MAPLPNVPALMRSTRSLVDTQSEPSLSSATPAIGAANDAGRVSGETWPPRSNESPLAVPTQTSSFARASKQLISFEGKPSLVVSVCHLSATNLLSPFDVPTQRRPAASRSIAEIEFEARPLSELNVVNRPPKNRLRPAFKVPAHIAPSVD